LQREISLSDEIFAFGRIRCIAPNVTGFLEVVQRSYTSGSLITHMWYQRAKNFFLQSNFQPLLEIKSCWYFVRE